MALRPERRAQPMECDAVEATLQTRYLASGSQQLAGKRCTHVGRKCSGQTPSRETYFPIQVLIGPADGNWKAARDCGSCTSQTVCLSGARLWPPCFPAALCCFPQWRTRRPGRGLLSKDARRRGLGTAAAWRVRCPPSYRAGVQFARRESGSADGAVRRGTCLCLRRSLGASGPARGHPARANSALAQLDPAPVWCTGGERG